MQLFSEVRDPDYLAARFSSVVKAFEGSEKLDGTISGLDAGISIEQLARVHDNLVSSARIAWFFVSNEKQYLGGTILVHFVDQKIDYLNKRLGVRWIRIDNWWLTFRSSCNQDATLIRFLGSFEAMHTCKRNNRPIWNEATPNKRPSSENLMRSKASRWRWTQVVILGLCVKVDESTRRQFPVILQLSVIGKTGCEAKSATERNKNCSRCNVLAIVLRIN